MSNEARTLRGTILKVLFALPFLVSGTLHLVRPAPFLTIMPPYLPYHLPLVYISGVCEIVLGIGLLIRQTQKAAAWGLIALLIAVFPANVYMATSSLTTHPTVPAVGPLLSWLRLPLQPLLILWAYAYTKSPKQTDDQKTTVNFPYTEGHAE